MTTSTSPGPGLIGLTQIGGQTGKLIRFGQWLNGDGFSDWEHAFVTLGNGLLVEAEPGGARVAQVTEYSSVYYCRNIAAMAAPAQLQIIADAAKSYVGVPYSFADYAALALHRFHLNDPELRRFIATSKHMICSQLCDQAYADAHVNLFSGRWEGYVTPGDLYQLDVSLGKTRGLS
jgi:hypothetical protein